jgi:hypothetical protein
VAAITELNELEDRTRRLAKESRAASTWRAYDSDLRHFQAWCAERQLEALPADPLTVASCLAALEETHRPSAIRRRLASISVAHPITGLETPAADAGVRSVWAGLRRRHGTAPRKSGRQEPRAARREKQWTLHTTATVVGLFMAYLAVTVAGQGTFPGIQPFHTSLPWAVAWFAGERTRLRRQHVEELRARAVRAEREVERERLLAVGGPGSLAISTTRPGT